MEEVMRGMREMKSWKEDLRRMKEEVKEGIKYQGRLMKIEMDQMRAELRDREDRWKEEREEMRGMIKELEKKMELLEKDRRGGGWRGKEEQDKGVEIEGKVRELEKRLEAKEREERRRNVIIRGIEVKEGRRQEAVEEMLRVMGARVKVKEIRKLGEKDKRGEIMLVKLENEEQRREVMLRKRNLRRRKKRVLEDWTWKERRMRWKLDEIARKEENNGKRVRVGYGKIRIEEHWWRWDEEEEVLRDFRGRVRVEGQGEEGEKEEMERL